MKKTLLALLLCFMSTLANAQTASQLYYKSGNNQIPVSSSSPLPIGVFDSTNHSGYCYTSNGSSSSATFQPCGSSGSSILLGTSTSSTNPHISGDLTTGLYTSGAGKVDVANSGVQSFEVAASTPFPLLYSGFGTSQFFFNSWPSLGWEIAYGTSASPITTAGAVVKISRTGNVLRATCNNNKNDNECNGTLLVEDIGLSTQTMQNAAIRSYAKTTSITTGSDAVGIAASGGVTGSGVSIGTGAFLAGYRSTNTGKALGVEIRSSNNTASSCSYNLSGISECDGAWITSTADGVHNTLLSSALHVGNGGDLTGQWHAGLTINSNSVEDTGFGIDDESTGVYGVYEKGSHTYAFVSGTSAGYVGFGTLTPSYPLQVLGAVTNLIYFGSTGARTTNVTIDANTSGQQAELTLSDGGTQKWQLGKNTSNGFFGFDILNNKNFLAVGTSGNMNVGEGTNLHLPAGGGADVGSSSDGSSLLSVNGNTSVGSGYYSISAPVNGAIIQGTVGIGTSVPDQTLTLSAVGVFDWLGRTTLQSPSDGVIALENNAGTDFTRLQLGGTTASFPAIKRNSAALNFRLADDSADAAITSAAITATGSISTTGVYQVSGVQITCSALSNAATTCSSNALSALATQANNTLVANLSGGVAAPSATSFSSNFQNSAGTFDLANAVTISGIISSGGHAVTGSTVPTNGIYLSAGNTLGFSTNTTRFGVIQSTGVWLISTASTTSAVDPAGNTIFPRLAVSGTTSSSSAASSQEYSNDAVGASYYFAKSRNTTQGSHTIVQSGDSIGTLNFVGSDGAHFIPIAQIATAVDGTPGSNDMPGRIVICTTPDGSATCTEAMRINNAQQVGIGTNNPTATLTVGSSGQFTVSSAGNLATSGTVNFTNATLNAPNLGTSSAATTGTLCWTTSTGLINVDTVTTCLASLEELKDKHGSITGALEIVSKLEPFWFTWKKTTPEWAGDKYMQPGLGAHQVESVDKRLAAYGPDGKLKGVRYQEMTAVLASAVKELNQKVDKLAVNGTPVNDNFCGHFNWLFRKLSGCK